MIIASENGHLGVVQALLAAGAEVNAKMNNGFSALMIASGRGHLAVVKALLAAKADVNAKAGVSGATALIYASQEGRLDVVQTLLAAKADVNAKAIQDITALFIASQEGHPDVVQALLAAKADVNARTANGLTALMIASQKGHPDVVQLLRPRSAGRREISSVNSTNGATCSTRLTVQLETFGEGVIIELRQGVPGNSKVFDSQKSSGGTVYFRKLCHGSYFMAIGNGDDVEVTPVRQFEDNAEYQSRIVVQRGNGNVTRKSRKSL